MAVGKEQSRLLNIAVAGGGGTGTIVPEWALARWLRVIPPSESDSYDVTFKDGDGDLMVLRTGMIGTMSEQLDISLGILKSIVIANSSSTGTYKLKMDMH